jgi:hypothetical protein
VGAVDAFLWWQPASAAETKIATTNETFFIVLVLSLVVSTPLAPARQQTKLDYDPPQGSFDAGGAVGAALPP